MSWWTRARSSCAEQAVWPPACHAGQLVIGQLVIAACLLPLACRAAPPVLDPEAAPRVARIEADQRHVYKLALEAGQYALVLLEQRGADVETVLRGPRGRALLRMDLKTADAQGVEPLHIVARDTGLHTLEVVLSNPDTAGESYGLRLATVRSARTDDRGAAALTRALAAGRVLRTLARRERTQVAEAPETAGGSYFRHAMAMLDRALARGRRAAPFLAVYAQEEQAALVREHEAATSATATAYANAWEQARRFTPRAAWQPAVHPRIWPTGSELALAHEQAGAVGKEVAVWQTLAVWSEARGEAAREASARGRLARGYRRLGRSDLALAAYQRAAVCQRAVGNLRNEATSWINMGQALSAIGEEARALALIDRGMAKLTPSDERETSVRDAVFARNARGDALRRLARLRESVATFHESWVLLETANGSPNEVIQRRQVVTLLGLARGHQELGDALLAWALYQRAFDTARGPPKQQEHLIGVALASRGRMLTQIGQPDAALPWLHEAVALRESQGVARRSNLASSLYALADARFAAGRLDRAKAAIDRALEVVESQRALKGAVSLRSAYLESKQQYYNLAIEILMALDRARPGRGYAVRALETAERRRARALGDRLAASSEGERAHLSPGLRAEEEALWQALANAERRLDRVRDQVAAPGRAAAGNTTTVAPGDAARALRQAEAGLEEARLAYEALEGRLRQQAPAYRPARASLSIDALRAQLDDATLLLFYNLGERASHVWVLGRQAGLDGSLRYQQLPSRDVLESQITAVWHGLQRGERRESRRAERQDALEALSTALLPPSIASQLADARLLVVKDGALHRLPLGSLTLPPGHPRSGNDGVERLLDAHEIVTTPSVGVLARLRERPPRPPSTRVAVVADALYQRKDPRLPPVTVASTATGLAAESASGSAQGLADGEWTMPRLTASREEGEDILALASSESRGFFGLAARRELLLNNQLAGFGYLHLAAHGDLRAAWPTQAALVLSGFDARGEAIEGRITAGEIQRCRFDAHTVVLSACGSGLGRAVRGEGLVGLSQAFLVAGAQRIVVSLWPIEDRASQRLMKRFYQEHLVRRLPPAEALRASQLWMKAQPGRRSDAGWAGFEIHGDWRPMQASD